MNCSTSSHTRGLKKGYSVCTNIETLLCFLEGQYSLRSIFPSSPNFDSIAEKGIFFSFFLIRNLHICILLFLFLTCIGFHSILVKIVVLDFRGEVT